MTGYEGIFERHEKKYLVSQETLAGLKETLEQHVERDCFGHSLVSSLYFDTPEDTLIARSMEKPLYKEKLRLRSYGTPTLEEEVFIELKKKFKGVVYKRRIAMSLSDAYAFISERGSDDTSLVLDASRCAGHDDSEVFSSTLRELEVFMQRYADLAPAMVISCMRDAFICTENPSLRITFDSDIRWRDTDLRLEDGSFGNTLLESGDALMEIKCSGPYPLWLAHALSALHLYPQSYSKYAHAYEAKMCIDSDQRCRSQSRVLRTESIKPVPVSVCA